LVSPLSKHPEQSALSAKVSKAPQIIFTLNPDSHQVFRAFDNLHRITKSTKHSSQVSVFIHVHIGRSRTLWQARHGHNITKNCYYESGTGI
jgi:hypothetical protein